MRSSGISVHYDDEPVVVEGRFRGNHFITVKKILKAGTGFLLLCAAFMAVRNTSSSSSRMAGVDGIMLEARASSHKREDTHDDYQHKNSNEAPHPEHFDWEKIRGKGQYDWKKCEHSSDPDCWKDEGQRIHSYWENFGHKMKSYWSTFGSAMHNFWAGVGHGQKSDHAVEATLTPVASPATIMTMSTSVMPLDLVTSTAMPPEDFTLESN